MAIYTCVPRLFMYLVVLLGLYFVCIGLYDLYEHLRLDDCRRQWALHTRASQAVKDQNKRGVGNERILGVLAVIFGSVVSFGSLFFIIMAPASLASMPKAKDVSQV